MTGVTLRAVGLTKRFGSRTAVVDVSFTAYEGEIIGLLGANGAGKTTTIRMLTTVLAPSRGEFWVAGIPGTRPIEIRRRVGVLPESAGYPAHQSGRDYLRYHARLFGRNHTDAARVTDRLLAEVGLGERATSAISTYSRGMRQRLGIARALVNDPVVVFLDEPTLGLDPAGQRQMLGIVRDVAARRGATVLLCTHTLPEVEEVCTTVLILDRGRVAVAGPVGEVTRAVTVRQSGRLRVPAGLIGRAEDALAGVPGLEAEPTEERPDILRISLTGVTGDPRDRADGALNPALRAVIEADVPVLSFEVEGARLATAFLEVTGSPEVKGSPEVTGSPGMTGSLEMTGSVEVNREEPR